MKIRKGTGTATGGVPKRTGGYDYSTGKSQNTLFNQGLNPAIAGAPDGKYDYSAKGRADRMYRMTGNRPADPNAVKGPDDYSTVQRKSRRIARVNKALKHS